MGGIGSSLGLVAIGQVPGADIAQLGKSRVEQADVHVAAHSRIARPHHGAHQAQGRQGPRAQIDQRQPRLLRRTLGVAGQAHPAGVALHQVVVPGFRGPLPAASEGREGGADDGPLDLAEAGVVQAHAGGQVAAQVVEDAIGPADQWMEHGRCLGMVQVEGDALLVAVEALEVDAVVAFDFGSHLAGDVASAEGVFDLDHLCSQVGQQHAGPGTGAELLDGQDANALQGCGWFHEASEAVPQTDKLGEKDIHEGTRRTTKRLIVVWGFRTTGCAPNPQSTVEIHET